MTEKTEMTEASKALARKMQPLRYIVGAAQWATDHLNTAMTKHSQTKAKGSAKSEANVKGERRTGDMVASIGGERKAFHSMQLRQHRRSWHPSSMMLSYLRPRTIHGNHVSGSNTRPFPFFHQAHDSAFDRIKQKRGSQRLDTQANMQYAVTAVETFMGSMLPHFHRQSPGTDDTLKKLLAPSWFGVVGYAWHSLVEPEGMGSTRVLIEGTRLVTVVPLADIMDMMKEKGVSTESLTIARACHLCKTITEETGVALCTEASVRHGTSGVREVL